MSIKDDFIYLNTTKKLLKNEINKIKNVLDDNSTFRSYPQELFNGYLDILNNGTDTLWSNLEKVSQIGTEAVLENVENAPMKIELSGNTSQDTTKGYNLLDLSNFTTETTINGVTFTPVENGGIKINGTASGYAILEFNFSLVLNGTYTMATILNGTYTNNESPQVILRSGDTTVIFNSAIGQNATRVQTFNNINSTIDKIRIVTVNGSHYDCTIYPMCLSGAYNVDNLPVFEKYTGNQPSPSPDYPQQVKVVTGENVVSVSGKNLCNGINSLVYLNGTVTRGGIANGNTGLYIKTNGKTYTISTNIIQERYRIGCTNSEPSSTVQDVFNGKNADGTKNSLTINTEGYEYLLVNATNLAEIQIEEGSTATEYQAFSKADYPITLSAENHFKGEFRRGGAVSTTVTTRLFSDDNYSMEADKQYVFETNLDMTQFNFAINISTREFPTTAMFDTGWLSSNKYVFTCAMDGHLGVPIRKKDDSIITLEDIDGVWFKLYEPIVETEETLELCKINTYKDYFHKDSGKWFKHKEIKKIVLDGTRNWIYQNEATTPTPRTVIKLQNVGLGSNLYFSSHFIKNSSSSNRIVILTDDGGGTIYLSLDNTLTGIDINDDSSSKVSKIKTWLSNNNVTLYYVLATPVEEEITNATLIEQLEAIYKAKSVKDKTYVTQTNEELPFVLDIQAIKEYNVD